MSTEENKSLVRAFLEKSNRERPTMVEMCADGIKFHIGATPTMDLQGFQNFQAAYYAAFSGSDITIEDIVAEGDRVAFRDVVRAVHSGAFTGTAASGEQIIVPVIGIARLSGGKMAEWWNSPDRLSWMQQIGALPS
jgi:predicted ester cyclase